MNNYDHAVLIQQIINENRSNVSLEDMAYGDARMDFETYRGSINDAALAMHEAGNEERAQELLAEARSLVYTGLMWRQDNNIDKESF